MAFVDYVAAPPEPRPTHIVISHGVPKVGDGVWVVEYPPARPPGAQFTIPTRDLTTNAEEAR